MIDFISRNRCKDPIIKEIPIYGPRNALNHDIKSPPPRMNHDCRTSKKVFHYDLPLSQSLPSISLLYTHTNSLSNFSNTIQNVPKCPEAACNRLQIRRKSRKFETSSAVNHSSLPEGGLVFLRYLLPSFFSPPKRSFAPLFRPCISLPSLRLIRGKGGTSFFPPFLSIFPRFSPPTNQRSNQKSHDMTNFAAQQRGELHIFNVKPTFPIPASLLW